MRVGDEYICIKDKRVGNGLYIHKKNNIYKLNSFNADIVRFQIEYKKNMNYSYSYFLSEYNNIHDESLEYFGEYLISLKEYRKLKLEKICSKSEIL